MNMNIRPSLRFQFLDLLKSSICFFASIVVITLFIPLIQLAVGSRGEVSFGGYAIIAAIYLFVVGIVGPRSYVRMDIQMGVSRATSFISQIIAVVLVSLVLSVAGEIMSAAVQAFTSEDSMFFVDIYQMMYNDGAALSFGGHLVSILYNVCICLFAYVSGMFYTLLFWRLTKVWTIVAALALVVLINVGLNASGLAPMLPWLGTLAVAFFDAVVESPVPMMIFFLVSSLILLAIEWLLLRRAYVRAAAG